MAIERVEWICPGCRRKYAIPATAPRPAMCPSCQELAGSSVKEGGAASKPVPPAVPPANPARPATRPIKQTPARPPIPGDGGLPDFEAAMHFEGAGTAPPFPDFELPDDEGETPTSLSIAAYRGKSEFGTLRNFVPVLRALAVILGLGSVGALLYSIYAAVALKDAAGRTAAIWGGVGLFVVGGVLTLLHFVLAELVRLALELEERTREE